MTLKQAIFNQKAKSDEAFNELCNCILGSECQPINYPNGYNEVRFQFEYEDKVDVYGGLPQPVMKKYDVAVHCIEKDTYRVEGIADCPGFQMKLNQVIDKLADLYLKTNKEP